MLVALKRLIRDESHVAILSLAGPDFKLMDTPHMLHKAVSIRRGCSELDDAKCKRYKYASNIT